MASNIKKKILQEKLEKDGYVIVDGLVPESMLQPLRHACKRVIDKSRNNIWKQRRVVGVQFAPWPKEANDIWGVENIMHPELKEPIFAEWYGSEKLIQVVCDILDIKEEDMELELFNLLINPIHTDYEIAWHRDEISTETPEEEEKERLSLYSLGIQWNTALYDDSSLVIVPGSHKRVRTEEERRVTLTDPLGSMPGQLTVNLKVGQTLFYIPNILHRAIYRKDRERVTLHACIGSVMSGSGRANGILQHDLEWMRSEEFRKSLPLNMHPKLDNLIKLADNHETFEFIHQNN